MRNRKKATIAAAIAAVFLAACGVGSGEGVSSGEIVVPEMSSEDLLVTSLEYLLEDEEGEQSTQGEETEAQNAAQQPGNVSSQSEDMKGQSGQEEPKQAEEVVQKEEAVIYYGKGDFSQLLQETIEIEEITPDELIDALARHNIVPLLDTKILSFTEEEYEGEKILRLDLSKAFGEYLRTMSKEAECIIVASVTDTFLENYSADALYLTVEGEALNTMNAAYEDALRQCEPDELLAIIDGANEDEEQDADTEKDEEKAE